MKNIKQILCALVLFTYSSAVVAQQYTDGVFILNEDWFGHNNSTINFLNTTTGEFDYLIYQEANSAENLSLGCTAQFGTVYGENIYVMSKQDNDSGEGKNTGGRIVVADAKTMRMKKSIAIIAQSDKGKSIADGRAFVGVNESKGYVGTSNGIYIMDLNSLDILGRIEGSENPLITGNESNADGNGPLYNNQIGLMIRTLNYVFAIQQDRGILVVDPETDKIVKVIDGCFSTMTQSKDGNIWVGVNTNIDYQKYPYGLSGEKWIGNRFLKIDTETLESTSIDLPAGGVNQTWYAWTAGSLCASTHENILYFTHNSNKWSWFTTSEMYKYDIDKNQLSKIFDSTVDKRYFYGGGIRISPLDDKIYATLYRDNNDQSYWVYQMDNAGNVINEYEPIKRYWFPAMPIFPDVHAPVVSDFSPITLNNSNPLEIDLSQMATDKDNLDAAITKRIISIKGESLLSATIANNNLILTAKEKGITKLTVRFNSNGKIVDKDLLVTVASTSQITEEKDLLPLVYANGGAIYIKNIESQTSIDIYNIHGQRVLSQIATQNEESFNIEDRGIYFVKIRNKTYKVVL